MHLKFKHLKTSVQTLVLSCNSVIYQIENSTAIYYTITFIWVK